MAMAVWSLHFFEIVASVWSNRIEGIPYNRIERVEDPKEKE